MAVVTDNSAGRVRAWAFCAVALLVLALAGKSLAQAWTLAPDLGHGWALPWLMGWLIYDRVSALSLRVPAATAVNGTTTPVSAATGDARSPGIKLWVALAFGVLTYGGLRLLLEPFPLWSTLLWALAGSLYAFSLMSAWLAGGRLWVRALAGPLALMFTAIPWPSAAENALLLPMRQGLASLVAEVLNIASIPAYAEGATIQIASGLVGVDEACGGMRSLQTALMIGWFIGELAGLGLARRISLLVLSALAAVAGNFLRALTLTWLTDAGGVALLDKWHDPAGYMALGCSLAVVLLLGWCWRRKGPLPTPATAPAAVAVEDGGGAKRVAPVLIARAPAGVTRLATLWVSCVLIGCVVAEVAVRSWYGSREKKSATVAGWTVDWPSEARDFRSFPLSKAAKEMLRPDAFSSAAWRTGSGQDRVGYYILWETGQEARNQPFLHGPEVCLPMTGMELVGRPEPLTVSVAGNNLPFDVYEFRQHDRPLYVFRIVWNPDDARAAAAPRNTDNWDRWFRQRWEDVLDRRVAVRAQVLTVAIRGEATTAEAEAAFRQEVQRLIKPVVQ